MKLEDRKQKLDVIKDQLTDILINEENMIVCEYLLTADEAIQEALDLYEDQLQLRIRWNDWYQSRRSE